MLLMITVVIDNSIMTIDIVFVLLSIDVFIQSIMLVVSHVSDIGNDILSELGGLLNTLDFVVFLQSIVIQTRIITTRFTGQIISVRLQLLLLLLYIILIRLLLLLL